MYHQRGDIRRGDAGDPAGLAQVGRADGGQLLPGLQAETLQMGVVHVGGDGVLFQLLELLHVPHLAADVALVLHGDLHLLRRGLVQRRAVRIKGGQIGVGELGPPQQVDEEAAVVDGGGAPLGQQMVE